MTASEGPRRQTGLEANDAERARWHAAAKAAGKPFAAWAREILDSHALGRTAGVDPPKDPQAAEDLEALRDAVGARDPQEVIRMALRAARRRMDAGQDPFFLARAAGPQPMKAAEPTAPYRPAGTPPRKRS